MGNGDSRLGNGNSNAGNAKFRTGNANSCTEFVDVRDITGIKKKRYNYFNSSSRDASNRNKINSMIVNDHNDDPP